MGFLTLDELWARRKRPTEVEGGIPSPPEDLAAADLLDAVMGGRAEGLAVQGGRALVRTARGVEVVDLTGSALRRVARVPLPGACRAVAATPAGLLAADDLGGLHRVEDGGIRTLVELGAPIRCVATLGDRIAVGTAGEVLVFDVPPGGDPTPASRTALPGGAVPEDLAFLGPRHLAVAAGGAGVFALGLDGAEARVRGWADRDARAAAPATGAEDRRMVVTWSPAGRIDVLEWAEEGPLLPVSSLDLEIDGGAPEGGAVVVDGGTAYVATDTRLLHVADLRTARDRCGPTLMSTWPLGTCTTGVAVSPHRVFVSDAYGGLYVLDRQRLDRYDDEDPVLDRLSFGR